METKRGDPESTATCRDVPCTPSRSEQDLENILVVKHKDHGKRLQMHLQVSQVRNLWGPTYVPATIPWYKQYRTPIPHSWMLWESDSSYFVYSSNPESLRNIPNECGNLDKVCMSARMYSQDIEFLDRRISVHLWRLKQQLQSRPLQKADLHGK